jgi:hypothetical protein
MCIQIDLRRFILAILGTTICLLGGLSLDAQSIGSKDFTQPQSPAKTTVQVTGTQTKWCEESGAGANADGEIINSDGPALTFSISRAELVVINRTPYIEIFVILKNHGIGSTLLPWSDSPVTSAHLSPDKTVMEVGYQLGTADFFLGAPFKNEGDLRLRSHVALWSQPNNEAQSIRIAAGQWIELHVRAEIVCISGDTERCLNSLHRSKLQVSGWWYQRLLTNTYKGTCIYSSAAYTEHELESHPIDVVGTPYQSSEDLILDSASAPLQ